MADQKDLKLARSKKVNRREQKEARKEYLEDDAQPTIRFIHEQEGEVTLFVQATFGLCAKGGEGEELKVLSRAQLAPHAEFGDPARALASILATILDTLSDSAGRDLTLHMLKAHIDNLVEKAPLKDKVARKTLRKYKMLLEGKL